MPSYKELLPAIRAFIFDVDGVFTDNTVILHPSGDLLRIMNVKDGYAVKLAIDKGYEVIVITGGKSETVRDRLETLGVREIFLGVHDKKTILLDTLDRLNIRPEHCLYMGDDIPDYEVMQLVGLAAAPQDAVEEIKGICHYISPKDGGKGCVRDVIEQTLRVQKKWFDVFVPST